MAKQYRIIGRFRKEDKPHVVDGAFKPYKTLQEAEVRLHQLQEQALWEMENRTRGAVSKGWISIGCEYHSEYDLLDLRIQAREVTPWEEVEVQ